MAVCAILLVRGSAIPEKESDSLSPEKGFRRSSALGTRRLVLGQGCNPVVTVKHTTLLVQYSRVYAVQVKNIALSLTQSRSIIIWLARSQMSRSVRLQYS